MFNRVITNLWKEIDQTIGSEKIFAGFVIKINTEHTSVTDFDHKQGNKANAFDNFLSPKTNTAKRLKRRFNSVIYCCAVTLNLAEECI